MRFLANRLQWNPRQNSHVRRGREGGRVELTWPRRCALGVPHAPAGSRRALGAASFPPRPATPPVNGCAPAAVAPSQPSHRPLPALPARPARTWEDGDHPARHGAAGSAPGWAPLRGGGLRGSAAPPARSEAAGERGRSLKGNPGCRQRRFPSGLRFDYLRWHGNAVSPLAAGAVAARAASGRPRVKAPALNAPLLCFPPSAERSSSPPAVRPEVLRLL